MLSRATWISLFLCLQVLVKVCESRVSVEICFTRYTNGGCTGSCLAEITFCLQKRDGSTTACSFGMRSFTTSSASSGFGKNDMIGVSNSISIFNPLNFSVDQLPFDIQLTAEGDSISDSDSLTRTRKVDVRRELNNLRNQTHRTRSISVRYSYIVRCAPMYYGPDCSTYCVGVDDETGHFTCDEDGSAVCRPGYTSSTASDERCTKCSENCITDSAGLAKFEGIMQTTFNSSSDGQDPDSLPAGSVAGIVIAVLFILAAVVGGVTGGVLLVLYRPWSKDSKVRGARTQSTSKALNNPIYDEKQFTGAQQVIKNAASITSDGAADLRDRTLRGPHRALDESSPLYSSRDSGMDGNRMEESVFVDNKSLVTMLDRHPPASSTTAPIPDISKGAPLVDPYASFTDGLPPPQMLGPDVVLDANGRPLQFDDNAYETVTVDPDV